VLARGVELLVITWRLRGAIATNGDYRIELDPPTVPVVETTGIGSIAAMITHLLPERKRLGSVTRVDCDIVREASTSANAVGALTCTKPGTIPALLTHAEVEQSMARQGEG
jgi:fructokinase